ncbi:MAG: hypothetical protein HY737_05860 [Candidatus Omnitrophica bacterium]|nr:hypothetical protein [Candidatus Omnitrophota bacterium]
MYSLLLIGAILCAYANSLTGPFLFDTLLGTTQNPLILFPHWPSWSELITPPVTAGRPIIVLSLLANAAIGGLSPIGYHVVNLAIHITAALVLYGLVRHTLALQKVTGTFSKKAPVTFADANRIAFVAALLWGLHPLQTQSVTYIIQRAESLMGLCYLFTLYCVCRSATAATPHRWWWMAFISCVLGMSTKAVMVTAPLLTLLYDRVFLAGSWGEAVRRRGLLYLGLAATWGWLAYLAIASGSATQGNAGPAISITPLEYLRSQPGVILHYLKLIVWPDPLVFDYVWPVATTARAIWPPTIVLGLLIALIIVAWRFAPAISFFGIAFFLLLAPTSTIFPIADLAAEHRLYLPLAPAVLLGILAADRVLPRRIGMWLAVFFVVTWGGLTLRRNMDYRSEEGMWRDVVAKRPLNARAQINLGMVLIKQKRIDEGNRYLQKGLQLRQE